MATPNFIASVTNPFGLTDVGSLSTPTFADIDNDGDLDAFVGASNGNTFYYENTGTASNVGWVERSGTQRQDCNFG